MRITAVEAEGPANEVKMIRRSWYDFRPVIVASLFLVSYLALNRGVDSLGPSSAVSHGHLASALSFGLLLAYGLRYAPMVFLAGLIDALFLHPGRFAFHYAVLYSLTTTVLYVAAAAALRRTSAGMHFNLRNSREVVSFITAAVSISSALAASEYLISRWQGITAAFGSNLIGFATGVFSITPLLLIHAKPRIESLLASAHANRTDPADYRLARRVDKSTALFAMSFLGLAAVVYWLIYAQKVSDGLQTFLLFSLPLIWVAVHRGLEGLAVAVPVLTGINIIAMWRYSLQPDTAGISLLILMAAAINAYLIGTGVTEGRVKSRQMERRDAILEAVSYAAQQFLGKSGWESGLQTVMKRLGEATSVTRVFITERMTEEEAQPGDPWLYEWSSLRMSADENDRRVLNLLRRQLVEEQTGQLTHGEPCLFVTKDIVHKKREMLEALGVRSMVIVPMFVDQQLWGCLGLEQCFTDRDWPASEIEGLKMAGQILGTLIASVRVEQQFRQLTGNIQAVFWVATADGLSKQYVSPGYEEIWGRSCASLQRQPSAWLQAVHVEDQSMVREALVKQAWGEYDEEFRVVRPDQSVRWVRDRAFPVRDQTGQVYRIVGIAEDITKHKKTEEQLRAATVLLSSLIDNLQSGVVVEDEARRITHVNQAFATLFNVPVPPQSLFGVDSRLLFIQPAGFSQRIEEIINAGTPILGEEMQWQDRIFIRNYVPLSVGEEYHYHLWQYRDITVSRHAEEQIKASLKEKEVLLKEIHHRVKNNLQIICSLLSLQSNEIEDKKACQRFKESQDRVKAMALIHERLYQSGDLAKIDFAGYVRNLTGHLLRSYRVNSSAIRLNLEVDSVPMNLDVAIPCGLIINELVSNSLKYAFPNGRSGGEISIRFADENSHGLKLVVSDNGVGFAEDTNPENSESLGLKLVRSLTDQLGGNVSYRNQEGFQCEIRIPRNRA